MRVVCIYIVILLYCGVSDCHLGKDCGEDPQTECLSFETCQNGKCALCTRKGLPCYNSGWPCCDGTTCESIPGLNITVCALNQNKCHVDSDCEGGLTCHIRGSGDRTAEKECVLCVAEGSRCYNPRSEHNPSQERIPVPVHPRDKPALKKPSDPPCCDGTTCELIPGSDTARCVPRQNKCQSDSDCVGGLRCVVRLNKCGICGSIDTLCTHNSNCCSNICFENKCATSRPQWARNRYFNGSSRKNCAPYLKTTCPEGEQCAYNFKTYPEPNYECVICESVQHSAHFYVCA